MYETFVSTLSPMLVMFLFIIIGFILKKYALLPDNADITMSKLENYIFVPALILSTFMNYCTVDSIRTYYTVILYSIFALIIALLISIPLSYVFSKNNQYVRHIYKYALTFGNFGFMGNAIVPAVLASQDSEILYKYLLFTLPLNIAVYTWGVIILVPNGHSKGNPLKNLINPIFISLFIGIVIGLAGLTQYIPNFILTTIDYSKACMAPVAMILTGFVVGRYNLLELLTNKKVYIATALRLLIIPTIILIILKLVGASDLVMTLALFSYATPLGLNTVVFPSAYGGETKTGASMAMISHTLCVITIPILFTILTLVL